MDDTWTRVKYASDICTYALRCLGYVNRSQLYNTDQEHVARAKGFNICSRDVHYGIPKYPLDVYRFLYVDLIRDDENEKKKRKKIHVSIAIAHMSHCFLHKLLTLSFIHSNMKKIFF